MATTLTVGECSGFSNEVLTSKQISKSMKEYHFKVTQAYWVTVCMCQVGGEEMGREEGKVEEGVPTSTKL